MDLNKILLGYIAKQHGISETAAADLLFDKSEEDETKLVLKEDALKVLLDKDAERVETLKGSGVDKTKIYDEAYAKAKKDELGKAEKKLAEKYGIEGTHKLDKLVDVIVTKSLKETEGEITEDKVKAHPTYLALETAKNDEISSLQTSHEAEVQKINNEYARTEVLTNVKGSVATYFDALNPVLSKDATKAANQRKAFLSNFDGYEYQTQDSGDPLILKDGKRLEDAHGNPITLESLVKDTAEQYYDFAVQSGKGSPGNRGAAGGQTQREVPADRDAYLTAIFEATTVEARQEIKDTWVAAGNEE